MTKDMSVFSTRKGRASRYTRLTLGLALGIASLVIALVASTSHAQAAGASASLGFATYHDSVYGYSLEYPNNWQVVLGPSDVATFLSPGPMSACQINISVSSASGSMENILAAAVPKDASAIRNLSVDNQPAISFSQIPHYSSGVSGSLSATRKTVAITQQNRAGSINLYTLTSFDLRQVSALSCSNAFLSMTKSLQLLKYAPSAAKTLNTLTNPNDPAVQYAENHWSWCWWNSATDASDPNGCTSSGSQSGKFECAEFVARSLAAKGLIPGLASSSDQTAYENYTYPANGKLYHLWNVGTNTTEGLYQFLIDSGVGTPVGDNPAAAVPGDPVFYYNGTPASDGSNRMHTALLIQTGTTPGGNDTLIDEHNDPGYHWYYASISWSGRVIVHISTNSTSTNNPPVTLGTNQNGSEVAFARGSDGSNENYWISTQSTDGAWSSWVTVANSANFNGDPVVFSNTDGRQELLGLGYDNNIYYSVQSAANSPSWSTWARIANNYVFQGQMVVGTNQNGSFQIFAHGSDQNYWSSLQSSDGSWSGWSKVSNAASFNGDPVVFTNTDGKQELLGLGYNNNIYYSVQSAANSSSWSTWATIANNYAFQGKMALGTNQNGSKQVFAHGSDQNYWSSTQSGDGVWSGWTKISNTASFNGNPVVFMNSDGKQELLGVGYNNNIYYSVQSATNSSTWSIWAYITNNDAFQGQVVIGTNQNGSIQAFAHGSDPDYWTSIQSADGSWSTWAKVSNAASFNGDPFVFLNTDGRQELLGLGYNNNIYYSVQTSANSTTWGTWAAITGGSTFQP